MKPGVKFSLIVLIASAALLLVPATDILAFLNFENLKAQETVLSTYRQSNPVVVAAGFAFVLFISAALPLPIIGLLSLGGGVLFGFVIGLALSSVFAALGATAGFLLARQVGPRFVGRWLNERHRRFQIEMARAGFVYAAAVRLLPVPFFLPGYLLGLTEMRASIFYFATQLGLLPVLAVLVNAGANIAEVERMEDIFAPRFLVALGLIAFLAIGTRLALRFHRRRGAGGQGG